MYIIDEIETLPDEFDKSDTSDKKMMQITLLTNSLIDNKPCTKSLLLF